MYYIYIYIFVGDVEQEREVPLGRADCEQLSQSIDLHQFGIYKWIIGRAKGKGL